MKNCGEYFSHVRLEILEEMQAEKGLILSVGCGEGNTEKKLISRGCRVIGVEVDPEAADVAKTNGLDVYQGRIEDNIELIQRHRFDGLIFADVLEHMPNPDFIFKQCVAALREKGEVVIGIPNFRHWSVFKALFFDGIIPDDDAGIFDKTHLRITTRKLVQKWYAENGVALVKVQYFLPGRFQKFISFISFRLLDEFISRQLIVTGRKE